MKDIFMADLLTRKFENCLPGETLGGALFGESPEYEVHGKERNKETLVKNFRGERVSFCTQTLLRRCFQTACFISCIPLAM